MRLLFLILISLTLTNCKGQEKNKQSGKPKKEKNMKTFNIETFNKKKSTANEYFFTKEDGTIVKQYSGSSYYLETIKTKDSIFELFNYYYQNGKLKLTVKRFPDSFSLGIQKEYDEQGNLIKETNLDKPFTYTWEDVKKYLQEHGVKDFEKDIIGIERYNNSQGTTWGLVFKGKYKKLIGHQFRIKLDGKTGEELMVELFKGKDADGEDGTVAVYDTIYKNK